MSATTTWSMRFVAPLRRRVLLQAVATAFLIFPSAGWALSPGVHYDPGSPAGKQYAIALNSARGTGSPDGGGNSALFGAGITPSSPSRTPAAPHASGSSPGATSKSPSRTAANGNRRSARSRGPASTAATAQRGPASLPQVAVGPHAQTSTGGFSATGVVVLTAGAVLLIGLATAAGMQGVNRLRRSA